MNVPRFREWPRPRAGGPHCEGARHVLLLLKRKGSPGWWCCSGRGVLDRRWWESGADGNVRRFNGAFFKLGKQLMDGPALAFVSLGPK
jgi:hypothetical protein